MVRALFTPVTWLLAVMSLLWIEPFGFKVPYYFLALVILYAGVSLKRVSAAIQFVRDNSGWIVPLMIYLTVVGIVLYGSFASNTAPRQAFYLLGVIALAGCLATMARIGPVLRVGAGSGIIILIAAIEFLARRLGLSWIDVFRAFWAGNFKYVVFDFFREVFNALSVPGDRTRGAYIKNDVADGLLIVGLLYRAGASKGDRDVLGIVGLGIVLVILLLFNTRSVLIAAGASLILSIAIGAAMRPKRSLPGLLVKGAGALAALVIALSMSAAQSGASQVMTDRFSFEDASAAARVEQFTGALTQIQLHPLTGNGYSEVDGYVVHNLFLGAWLYAGVFAFLLVTIFYVTLLVQWLRTLKTYVTQPQAWVLPISFEWIAPLPILLLVRVWLSGDSGHPFLGEWIAVAMFFGCVQANSRQRRRMIVRGTQPPMPDPANIADLASRMRARLPASG